MCSATSRVILPEPPEELKLVSDKLARIIRAKIELNGAIGFSDFMEMALYQPGLGYYSAGLHKFGETGDFVTAPLLGDLFARCLAKQVEQVANELDQYEILEAGAGNGVLAADLLKFLEHSHPPDQYRILERSAYLRQVQKETFSRVVPHWMDRIKWLDKPPDSDWQGVMLANEVLDALTVDRFCITSEGIRQLQVGVDSDRFRWINGSCPTPIEERVQAIISGLERPPGHGYCSEINTRLSPWLEAITASMNKGVALFIDYGYPRTEYYRPDRRDGTLICHYRHRAHDDPFHWPGLTDISAFVDFTALAEAADYCDLEVSGYTSQAMFLMACGLDKMISNFQSLPQKQQILMHNQVRRLTSPTEMGERFQVMALGRGLSEESGLALRGFSLADLRYRL